jgi:hypothetical protein
VFAKDCHESLRVQFDGCLSLYHEPAVGDRVERKDRAVDVGVLVRDDEQSLAKRIERSGQDLWLEPLVTHISARLHDQRNRAQERTRVCVGQIQRPLEADRVDAEHGPHEQPAERQRQHSTDDHNNANRL